MLTIDSARIIRFNMFLRIWTQLRYNTLYSTVGICLLRKLDLKIQQQKIEEVDNVKLSTVRTVLSLLSTVRTVLILLSTVQTVLILLITVWTVRILLSTVQTKVFLLSTVQRELSHAEHCPERA